MLIFKNMKNLFIVLMISFASVVNADSNVLFSKFNLDGLLDKEVFEKAYSAHTEYSSNKRWLVIIDYTKPSTEKRFFVLDMKRVKIKYYTLVSHGAKSGFNYTTKFSNVNGSNATSLGIFKTAETYYGNNGYSLKLDGLSKNLNDQARNRYIVVHGATYANPEAIVANGGKRLGRSQGCPALPVSIAKQVINDIKGGSIIYSHGVNKA